MADTSFLSSTGLNCKDLGFKLNWRAKNYSKRCCFASSVQQGSTSFPNATDICFSRLQAAAAANLWCNVSKWRTGQRERLKNQSDFAKNTQHTPPLKRSRHEAGIQNCMILKSRRLTNPTRDWKFTILATALASMSWLTLRGRWRIWIFSSWRLLKCGYWLLLRVYLIARTLFTTAERTDWWFSPSSSIRSFETV